MGEARERSEAPAPKARPAVPRAPVVVEDDAAPGPGQLTRAVFLQQAESRVKRVVDAALAEVGRGAADCPYIDAWFAYYRRRSAADIMRAYDRYADEGPVSTAEAAIDALARRALRAAESWKAGQPLGYAGPGPEPPAALGGDPGAGPIVQQKPDGGGAAAPTSGAGALARIGAGEPFGGAARSRMESAFGVSFSGVRIHTEDAAAQESGRQRARAFTVGKDIAFARGQYRPGSLEGDALLAHELAHVQQQGSSTAPATDVGSSAALEENADEGAVAAMMRLHDEEHSEPAPDWHAAPSRGLRLSRCTNDGDDDDDAPKKKKKKAPPPPWWKQAVKSSAVSSDVFVRGPKYLAKLEQLLVQVNVQVVSGKETKKTPPGHKGWEYFKPVTIQTTQWTPGDVETALKKVFPSGKETLVWSKDASAITKVESIVADYRKKHPQTFSILQGREAATASKTPTSSPNCIATMNRGVEALYGKRTIQRGDMGTTVQDSISAVSKKGMVAATKSFVGTYSGTKSPLRIDDAETDVKLSGVGAWVTAQVKAAGKDGAYVFLVNHCNGFHSSAIMVLKTGSSLVYAWKDQLDNASSGTREMTEAQIDQRMRALCRTRYRFWLRDQYNADNDPDVTSVDHIPSPAQDAAREAAEKKVERSVKKDIGVNTVARLKPL